jgi:DNA primase
MSNFISEDTLNLIKDRVSIYDIVSKHVLLKQKGKDYLGLCPFHKEKTPSFTVNTQKNFYHCFGCGAHGDIFRFLTEHAKLSFPEAVEECAALAGIKLAQQTPQQEAAFKARNTIFDILSSIASNWHTTLRTPKGANYLAYLHQRGITDSAIQQFQVGVALHGETLKHFEQHKIPLQMGDKSGLLTSSSNKVSERFINRIIFPIFDVKHRIIGFGGRTLSNDIQPKYLNSPETDVFHKSEVLYGLHLLDIKHTTTIVVEGYLDVMALTQVGFKNVFAPMGTSLTPQQGELLIKHAHKIYFAFDGDSAGLKAAMRTINVMLPLLKPGIDLQFIMLPNSEDPHSIITQKGKSVFEGYISKSLDIVEFMLHYELTANPDTSPPAQALKRKTLLDTLNAIEDNYLKSLYKNKTYELFKDKKKLAERSRPELPKHMNVTNLYERIFLRAIIENPQIYKDLIEETLLEKLSAECLDVINIIETYVFNSETLEFLDIVPYIKSRMPTFNVDQLLTENLYMHAPFLKRPANVANITDALRKMLRTLSEKEALDLHIQEAKKRFEETHSLSDWERLKELLTEKEATTTSQTKDK